MNDIVRKECEQSGRNESLVLRQLSMLTSGAEYMQVDRPATLQDGIDVLDTTAQEEAVASFKAYVASNNPCFFIPASGAASRMFKALVQFVADPKENTGILEHVKDARRAWPFEVDNDTTDEELVRWLIESQRYHTLPKGLLPFHKYDNEVLTAAQEQVVAAQELISSKETFIHFTVAEGFENDFKKALQTLPKAQVTYSYQSKASDTPAVTLENQPFMVNDTWLFRPGGHGALIENLSAIEEPMVLLRNIDNIQRKSSREETNHWRQVVAGHLLTIRDTIHKLAYVLANEPTNAEVDTVREVMTSLFSNPDTSIWSVDRLLAFLNRPIRVCGMVKNEGEPGGGPFWAKNSFGEMSLQIVEKAQIDISNPQQMSKVSSSTHFNPVDIACWKSDVYGEPFDLSKFVDEKAFFVAEKNFEGKPLKALELPGLWNGAMSGWHTFFVEVPLCTFSPVKTVFDLAKPDHNQK